LQGIEVHHSDMTKEQMEEYCQMADALGLLRSGGSDFHGEGELPEVKLGIGRGQVNIPHQYIERIIAASNSAQNAKGMPLKKSNNSRY